MQSFRYLQLFDGRCPLQKICSRHISAHLRAAQDRVRADCARYPVLVTLVKADAQAPPLSIGQALKVLRVDICRKILNDSRDINQADLWGFYNSSPKTADVESDVWMTLRSIGVPKPPHVYNNQQLEQLEARLPEGASLVVDLSEPEGPNTEPPSPTVRNFLQTHPVELLRLSALLDTDVNVKQAEGAMEFYRSFLSVVDSRVMDNVIRQHAKDKNQLRYSLLQMLAEQDVRYHRHLGVFETRLAMDVLWETMLLVKRHLESGAGDAVPPLELLAVRERLVGHLEKLGLPLYNEEAEPTADGRLSSVIDAAAAFRREVRSFALQNLKERQALMAACDSVRESLLKVGIKLQDKKNQAPWLWAPIKK